MAASFGIEEEFLLVTADDGELTAAAPAVLAAAATGDGDGTVTAELNRCQVETNTATCTELDEAAIQLTRLREDLTAAGRAVGAVPVALATHPWSAWSDQVVNTDKEHYRTLLSNFQQMARRQVLCGCHIHVGVEDPEDRITVMNEVRGWLPVLLALSANSPRWQGTDTGYASWRTPTWRQWPTAVMPPWVADRAAYDELTADLLRAEVIDAPSALYWYVRPAAELPTVEFRVCDVCLDADDAVTIAGLARALTATVLAAPRHDDPPPGVLLDGWLWRGARYGLDGQLVDPRTGTLAAAAAVVEALVDLVGPALREAGDEERVRSGVAAILRRGNGATQQRAALIAHPERPATLAALRMMGVLAEGAA